VQGVGKGGSTGPPPGQAVSAVRTVTSKRKRANIRFKFIIFSLTPLIAENIPYYCIIQDENGVVFGK
jgi:hypothetical protein